MLEEPAFRMRISAESTLRVVIVDSGSEIRRAPRHAEEPLRLGSLQASHSPVAMDGSETFAREDGGILPSNENLQNPQGRV